MIDLIAREDTRWDLEEIRTEMNRRGFDDYFLDEVLTQRIRDFREEIFG